MSRPGGARMRLDFPTPEPPPKSVILPPSRRCSSPSPPPPAAPGEMALQPLARGGAGVDDRHAHPLVRGDDTADRLAVGQVHLVDAERWRQAAGPRGR